MAMPMPTEVIVENDRPSEQPASGTRARRSEADEEAMRLMMKVFERAEVARSFAKLAAGLLTTTAARASVQLRAVAETKMAGPAFKIARAAAEAAAHVATQKRDRETEREVTPEAAPEPPTA